MSTVVAALLNSLDVDMLLFIIAGGLSIIFGVLGILNFAHGAIYILGAYLAYTSTYWFGNPYFNVNAISV